MNIDLIRSIIAAVLFLASAVMIIFSVIGVFRFHFALNRMHSAAIIDAMALGLILIGLMVLTGSLAYIPKLILILAFQWIGSPIASHMVGRLEVNTNDDLEKYMDIEK